MSYPHYNFVRVLENGVQLINLCPLSELERLSRDIRSHRDDGALLRECPACTEHTEEIHDTCGDGVQKGVD
jgi:diaminopimelate decarboxylase